MIPQKQYTRFFGGLQAEAIALLQQKKEHIERNMAGDVLSPNTYYILESYCRELLYALRLMNIFPPFGRDKREPFVTIAGLKKDGSWQSLHEMDDLLGGDGGEADIIVYVCPQVRNIWMSYDNLIRRMLGA